MTPENPNSNPTSKLKPYLIALAGFALLFFLVWWLPQLFPPQKVSTETPQEVPKKESFLQIEGTNTKTSPTSELTEEVIPRENNDPLWFLVKEEFKDLSKWSTYKNEKYGFEISYPTSWGIRVTTRRSFHEMGEFLDFEYPAFLRDGSKYYTGIFGISVYLNEKNLSFKEWLEKYFTDGYPVIIKDPKRIGKNEWLTAEFPLFAPASYFLKQGKFFYLFDFGQDYDGLTETKNRDKLIKFIENKILSTFKLI